MGAWTAPILNLNCVRHKQATRRKQKEIQRSKQTRDISTHLQSQSSGAEIGDFKFKVKSYIVFERNPNPTPPPVTEFEVQKAPCFFCPLPRSCCEDSERQEGLTQLVYSMGASFFSSDSQNDLHSNSQTNSSSHPAELVCPQDPGPADPGVRIPLTTLKGHWHQGF